MEYMIYIWYITQYIGNHIYYKYLFGMVHVVCVEVNYALLLQIKLESDTNL